MAEEVSFIVQRKMRAGETSSTLEGIRHDMSRAEEDSLEPRAGDVLLQPYNPQEFKRHNEITPDISSERFKRLENTKIGGSLLP